MNLTSTLLFHVVICYFCLPNYLQMWMLWSVTSVLRRVTMLVQRVNWQAIKLHTRRTVVISSIAVIGKRSRQLASRQWLHSVPLKAPAKASRILATKLTAAKTPPAVTLTTVTKAQRFTSACSWWSFAVLLAWCLSNSKETEKRFCNELRLAYVNETCTIN